MIIELNGRVTRIIYKSSKVIKFFFEDIDHGEYECAAGRNECILYHNIKRGKRYKLKAQLKGMKIEKHGQPIINHKIFVKEVHEL
jgi:hypothetical protein